MIYVRLIMSKTTLNINGLNVLTKGQRLVN